MSHLKQTIIFIDFLTENQDFLACSLPLFILSLMWTDTFKRLLHFDFVTLSFFTSIKMNIEKKTLIWAATDAKNRTPLLWIVPPGENWRCILRDLSRLLFDILKTREFQREAGRESIFVWFPNNNGTSPFNSKKIWGHLVAVIR